MTGREFRMLVREGRWRRPTAGVCPEHVQANLVVVPHALAFDFLLFCHRNPKPCPLVDVTDPGSTEPTLAAPGADLRTDVPGYCVYHQGVLQTEPDHLRDHWPADGVGFLLGCSFTFEKALLDAGLPVRHLEEQCNVPMYRTTVLCRPAGVFHGPLVVSMRPMTELQASRARSICARFPHAHGVPVHIGDPSALGITDLSRPDFGDPVTIHAGEIPVFWACGVTPQAVAMAARLPLLLTHKPGHMFVTDQTSEGGGIVLAK